ncbi:MAG TPA: hypothetical protein VFI70_10555 [Nitrososphaeraceae archaeon]|nr:hypothetical protein [Nitrososphaeraceae archaeon]
MYLRNIARGGTVDLNVKSESVNDIGGYALARMVYRDSPLVAKEEFQI